MGTGSGNVGGGGSGCLDARECSCCGSPGADGGHAAACRGLGGPWGETGDGDGADHFGRGYFGATNAGATSSSGWRGGPTSDRFDGFQVPLGLEHGIGGPTGQIDGDHSDAVRLGSPGEVAAAVPHFFGFHPDSSVVVLGLSRPGLDCRAGIDHGVRVDLDVVQRSPAAFGRWIAGRLVDSGAGEALCLVYPAPEGPARMADYRRLVAGMCAPLRIAGVTPLDVLFINDGRWWSFLCDRLVCCPPEGSPIDTGASAIAVLTAYSGLAVLPNRAALAACLEPYGAEMAERMRAACDAALNRCAAERAGGNVERPSWLADAELTPDLTWSEVTRIWRLADDLCAAQAPLDRALTDRVAGELLVGLTDARIRDHLATWCGDDRAGQAVALGVELARRAVTAEQSAAAYSVAAWATWSLGWGAWSRLCVEKASAAVPGYALAGLIKQGLDRGIGPELVREAARGTARRLDAMNAEMAAEQFGTRAA
jgi:hypothetical protein